MTRAARLKAIAERVEGATADLPSGCVQEYANASWAKTVALGQLAREDAPWLLAEIERLRTGLESIAVGITGRRRRGGDPMKCDWQIAQEILEDSDDAG